MEKKIIIEQLEAFKLLDTTTDEQKIAVDEAIRIIKKEKKKNRWKKAVDILIRLLGIGSDYFN